MCLMTCVGWLWDVLTYNKESLGFLYGRYVPFVRLKVTSKNNLAVYLDFNFKPNFCENLYNIFPYSIHFLSIDIT